MTLFGRTSENLNQYFKTTTPSLWGKGGLFWVGNIYGLEGPSLD